MGILKALYDVVKDTTEEVVSDVADITIDVAKTPVKITEKTIEKANDIFDKITGLK